jgi:hypothetical protein
MYFLSLYEYGTLKPVEDILRRGSGKKKKNGGDYIVHICENVTVIPMYN